MPVADQISVPKAINPASDVSAPELASSRSTLACSSVPGSAPSSHSTTSSRAPAGRKTSRSAASSATNGHEREQRAIGERGGELRVGVAPVARDR